MKTKRIKWLDFAKGFTIFFVIFGHWGVSFKKGTGTFNSVLEAMLYISFTFIMPLFFAISGYLYKHISSLHDYILLIYKKTISLLIPYLFFSILATLNNLRQSHNLKIHSLSSVLNLFLGYKYQGYLWFLLALFGIFIIVGFLDLIHTNFYIQIVIFILLTLIQPDFWLLANNQHMHLNIIYCTVSYALIFYLGMILKKLFNKENIHHAIININNPSLFVLVIAWLLTVFIQSRFTILAYQTGFITVSDAFTKFSIVILAFMIFMNLKHSKFFDYFTYYGKYTLTIYLMHWIFIMLLSHLDKNFVNIAFATAIFVIGLFVIWELSIFTCYLSNKFSLINFVFYPRKYINKLIIKTKFGKYLLEK